MKKLIIVLIILTASFSWADDSLFVHDSLFAYYSNLGDKLLSKYRANTDLVVEHGECLKAYFKAIDAVEQSRSHDQLKLAKAHFQFANAVLVTDTLWHGAPYVENWRLVKSHFIKGSFYFSLNLLGKYDKKKCMQLVEEFDKYFNAYIWLLEVGGDPQRAKEIKQRLARRQQSFK